MVESNPTPQSDGTLFFRHHAGSCVRRAALLVTLAVCLATPLAVGSAAAHQFVVFGERSVQAVDGEQVTIPVEFHETDAATLRVEGVFAVELRDTDGDGAVRVRLDLSALPDGLASEVVTVESGTGENPRTNSSASFGPGNYTLSVAPPAGTGDETRLLVGANATPTAPTTERVVTTPTESAPSVTTTASAATAATQPPPDDSTPRVPLLVLALFGPAVPVAALVVAARRFR